jgi:preprotein translocase SecE subunit
VAESSGAKRRPRIRKSAPTVRQRVEEAAKVQESGPKKSRARKLASTAARPARRLRLNDRRAVKTARVPFRYLKRGLAWIIPSYFVNSWRELRKVIWPRRRETWRLTLAVFIFATIFGALVAGVDKGLDEIFKKVVLK